ncbi:MAG: sigma-54-dependent Fis family transcriptional regulator [Candidatus Aminicenantes bacterium]|nr:MAG: sigma-54-dependent Fis family transcriptional regulator [Candidatus Aminicenantes bacterium]
MNNGYHILIVEDDKIAGKAIGYQLKDHGYQSHFFEKAEEALLFFQQHTVDLVLLDYKLPGMSGEEFFLKIKEINPLVPVIFMTIINSVDKAVRLLKMGAFTYLTKPMRMDDLFHNINNALEKAALTEENQRLQESLRKNFSFENYIFNSENMQPIMDRTIRAANSNANILITGESGTGKDVIANIIHQLSKRKNKKLIKVNLAALPETLIEAELFGAVKGAYTGAVENRRGRFEEAQDGTLFLDEIAELSPVAQVKLLRVTQDREITRLGSNEPIKVDIRLITATNKDLQKLVREEKFREDLYYRLNVINITLPPLRERKEDIPHLIDWFIKKYNQRESKQVKAISREALSALMKYTFPGNIRELENIIESSLVLAKSDILVYDDLPLFVHSQKDLCFDAIIRDHHMSLPEKLNIIEKNILENTLKKHNHHQTRAAQELGISESRLRYKIQTYKLGKG